MLVAAANAQPGAIRAAAALIAHPIRSSPALLVDYFLLSHWSLSLQNLKNSNLLLDQVADVNS
jgi:hypothetical protein